MNELVTKAAALARSSPRQWEEFLAEFKAYSSERKDECVKSPVEMLQVTQGRAQQCDLLVTLLSNAVKDADRIADKKSAQQRS